MSRQLIVGTLVCCSGVKYASLESPCLRKHNLLVCAFPQTILSDYVVSPMRGRQGVTDAKPSLAGEHLDSF